MHIPDYTESGKLSVYRVLHGARHWEAEPQRQDQNKTGNALHGARLLEPEQPKVCHPMSRSGDADYAKRQPNLEAATPTR